jgi:spore germination protein YaaH
MEGQMRRLLTGFVTCLLVSANVQAQDIERIFYYTDNEDAWESLVANVDRISIVAPGGYSVDAEGIVWGEVDPRVVRLGRERSIPVMPLLVNPGFNQELLTRLLNDSDARARAIASLVELCQRHGHYGIQIDFENVAMPDRDALTQFYREAAEALHRGGFRISIAVVHRPDDLAGPTRYHEWLFRNWRAGYDVAALAEIGDFISVMTYSQHTRRTPPGPQAGIPWVEDVVAWFLERMPANKLSLGIPTGSQHWYTSQEDRIQPEMALSYSENVPWRRAMALVERNGSELIWSEEHKVPYAFYSRGGTFEWVFLENGRSFEAKLDLVRRHGLRGFSVWVIGAEDPAVWSALPPISRRD